LKEIAGAVADAVQSGALDAFHVDPKDFVSARESQESVATRMTQEVTAMDGASEALNRSTAEVDADGDRANVISPVVIPKDSRSLWWLFPVVALLLIGAAGSAVSGVGTIFGWLDVVFGWHYWLVFAAYAGFSAWKNSFVMIPDGCQALITKFGKLVQTVGPGRTWLVDPRKKIGYIVNTTKKYPYNAPIRQAPTAGRVNASVDLFLQFQIEDPENFIFTLGGVNGFAEKLQNAVSEVTRALIYEQKAEAIYDLVGESTEPLLAALNRQFLPAVRLVNANITHAEPSSQEYRMDLAAAEIVRVAKEAYTYEYELGLRKQQDEGDLAKELASMLETLSEIQAGIARFQAQIDTAREKEANRANAYARQLLAETESEAKANAALLEAQALDIRALSSAAFPEILEHRFRRKVLDSLEAVAPRLPRIVSVGSRDEARIDFSAVARQMLGIEDRKLFDEEDLRRIRARLTDISQRVESRTAEIEALLAPPAIVAAPAEVADGAKVGGAS
jgi:regulator of protease activity HflC (stomatin/prohibitin superfamily)